MTRRREYWFTLAFVAVVLFGIALRVARLHSIPPGLFFDEAANLFDVSDVLNGAHPLYFPRNNGREPFFFYWASLFAGVWGPTPYAIRLASAVVGALTVVATFLCAREFFRVWSGNRRWADWTALASAFVLSITYTHLHYSRIGLRSITLPLFLALSYGLLFRGLRRNSWWALALAGVAGGLSLYTYIPSRIAPLPVLLLPLTLGFPRRTWRPFWQMAFVGVIWVVVCLPFGVYTLRHPQDVLNHTDDVSILNQANNKGDLRGAVVHGVLATLGGFSFVGTENADQNLPGRPILDPALSLFFFVGLAALVVSAIREKQPAGAGCQETSARPAVAVFLVSWILTQSVPSALAVGPPGFIRMTGTLPAVAIVVGAGLGFAWRWLAGLEARKLRASAILTVALVVSTGWTVRDYFWIWGPSITAYHWMMGDKVDSATYLNRWAAEDRVFLAPLFAQDNTIRFLTRGAPIQSFDLGVSLVVPTDRSRGVRYVFPSSDETETANVARELPVPATTETVQDPTNRFDLLTVLDVAPAALPPVPSARLATFDGGGIALVSATVEPEALTPGQPLVLTLEWLDLKRQPYDYTAFVHLRDAANQAVTQVDRQPTAGSFPTTAWRPGDLIWDRYSLSVPASVHPGEYRLVAGLYRLATMQRLSAQPGDGQPPSNEVTIATVRISAN